MKKKYLLILPVIVIIAVLFKLLNNDDKDSQQTDFDKTCYLVEDDDKLLKTIQAISKYGSEGDLKKLSQYIDYPLRRQYPLPVIKDSSDFVKYAGIIWDDSLKNILKTLKPEDWKGYGWEGFSFKDGIYIWTDGDKITGINYYSTAPSHLAPPPPILAPPPPILAPPPPLLAPPTPNLAPPTPFWPRPPGR